MKAVRLFALRKRFAINASCSQAVVPKLSTFLTYTSRDPPQWWKRHRLRKARNLNWRVTQTRQVDSHHFGQRFRLKLPFNFLYFALCDALSIAA